MSNLIQTTPIEGLKVYGQQMVDYTVAGTTHRNFAEAISVAAFAEAGAIEVETAAYAKVLKARQKKLDDLTSAVSKLAVALASMDPDEPESDDKYPDGVFGNDQSLKDYKALLESYGVSLPLDIHELHFPTLDIHICRVRRDDAERAKANAEYEIDKENNDMQQDMVTLQGLVSKRDQSYSTAAKVIKKYNSTGDSIIRSVGV